MNSDKIYKPSIYAHRGASAHAPENTMAAFELAKNVGANGMELDVHLTKDGQVVVIHDNTIDRTSNGTGQINELYYSDIKTLDFGSWKSPIYKGESIPLLVDVCSFAKNNNILLNIEIKPTAGSSVIEEKLIDICKTTGIIDLAVISSFDHYSLRNIKMNCKSIKTAILYESNIIDVIDYAKEKVMADGIHPYIDTLTDDCIENAIQNNIPVRPWTVDNAMSLKRLAKAKEITAIITNYPAAIQSSINELFKL